MQSEMSGICSPHVSRSQARDMPEFQVPTLFRAPYTVMRFRLEAYTFWYVLFFFTYSPHQNDQKRKGKRKLLKTHRFEIATFLVWTGEH